MKCPNCGGQMGLEDAACPYCGTPNAQAAQHQSDMARFQREYAATQETVLEKTSFMQQQGSWLAVLSVLLAALVIGIVLQVNAWDIGYSIREDGLRANAAADSAMLDSYLESGDYGKFVGYYDANGISMDYESPYQALRSAAYSYVSLLQYVGEMGDSDGWAFKPDYISDTCGYIAEDLNRIYTVEQQYSYDLDRYLPERMRGYLDDIRERASRIAQVYFGLTAEDVERIPDLSKRKLGQLIEEGIAA